MARATSQRPAGSPNLRQRVAAAFEGGRRFTADELAQEIDEPILNVRPQVSALACSAKLVDTGERRRNASGKNAIVWTLT